MQAGCRIRTRVIAGSGIGRISTTRQTAVRLRFPTDSKTLSLLRKAYVGCPKYPLPPVFEIGSERALTEVPTKFKVLHPEDARRKL
jgi:hypothetical protein